MSDTHQLAEDLEFVRKAVEARDKRPGSAGASVAVWAAYCLICIPSYDFTRYGGRINLAGFIIAAIVSVILGKRQGMKSGQYDRGAIARTFLHFYGGSALLMLTTFGLAYMNPSVDGTLIGQISILLVGFMYFYGGIHLPEVKFMRWVGPIIILAGVLIVKVPHYPWTAMGIIFAVCLISPVVFGRRSPAQA